MTTKIESITITPFNISVPISSVVEIVFTNAIDESNISSYLTIRDRNLKLIPSTNISLSVFNSSNNKKWMGNVNIHQANLYYQDAQILGNYNNHYIVAKLNVDTVTTYTYSNEMRGPNNGTLIAHYKPCYKIERINNQIVNVFEEDITHNKCAIFGISEKTYESVVDGSNNTKMGYKNSGNGNYEFYNSQGEVILSNGIPDISKGYGSINSNAYTFRFTIGFITYTLSNVAYSNSLLNIINDVLGIWSSMVNKPIESKFINANDYENYSLTISFIIREFEPSIQESMTSEIVSSYGTNFGSIFPKTSIIKISKTYIEGKLNSGENAITNDQHIHSITQYLKRSIGNALGIGHYWYLPTSPIDYDVMNHKYYKGENGVNKYKELFSSHSAFNGKLFGLPIEDYEDSNIFLEEGEKGSYSKKVTLNGFTHPGLKEEVMTKWIDIGSEIIPISIVSLGLLEDIGYDICYNNVDIYSPSAVISSNYEIYIDYDLSINMFERLTDVYIQNKNNYHVKISTPITQYDLNKLLTDYITTVIKNIVSNPINELTVTHNSNVDAHWVSFDYDNNVSVNILQNTNNETNTSANDTRVYKFTTIKHDDGSITALLDKQINV